MEKFTSLQMTQQKEFKECELSRFPLLNENCNVGFYS